MPMELNLNLNSNRTVTSHPENYGFDANLCVFQLFSDVPPSHPSTAYANIASFYIINN